MGTIRLATPADARAMAEIHLRAWQEAYRDFVPAEFLAALKVEAREAAFQKELSGCGETPFQKSYVWTGGGETKGFLTIGNSRDADLSPEKDGELRGLYLDPSEWRKGYGNQMFRYGEERLREQGFSRIVVWVFAENAAARSFYEALGYRLDGAEKTVTLGRPLRTLRYCNPPPRQ